MTNSVRPKRFKTMIATSGTKTYIVIPFDPNEIWGAKDRHYITGSIDGCRIRGVLVAVGMQFLLSLGPAWLRDNDVAQGVKVEVVLSPDGPLAERLAPDVAAALEAAPEAKTFFASIAPFYRKNLLRWIESAKRPPTRAAHIAEMVTLLEARKDRR